MWTKLSARLQIAAPPERVFQALVDPSQVVRWWGQIGHVSRHGISQRPAGGRKVEHRRRGRGRVAALKITGEYLEIDPPRLLAHPGSPTWTGDVKTTVRWELEPTKEGTLGPNSPLWTCRLSGNRAELQRLAADSGLAERLSGARRDDRRSQAGRLELRIAPPNWTSFVHFRLGSPRASAQLD